MRRQALDWLRGDLALYRKLLESGRPADRRLIQQRMEHWQKDPDLSGLRGPDALARLPAEERAACEKLWVDVAALLHKAQEQAQ